MSRSLTGAEPNLVAYWNFDDGTANELTANHNNGSFVGNATTVISEIPGFAKPAALVFDLRASQRPGTKLVDILYNLSAPGPVAVAVTVSTNGGATYGALAGSLQGAGAVSPGIDRRIIWDAGQDWPGQYSSQVQIRVTGAGASWSSGKFTLDTRGGVIGSIAGRVVDAVNSSPLANAGIAIDGTGYATNTSLNGTFTLANVAVGAGYLLSAAADGYGTLQTNSTLVSGTLNAGDLRLPRASRPYRFISLVPDGNPSTTMVESGGTAYRYYRVVASDGRTPVGGVAVSVQIQGGSSILQTGDTSDYWAGRVAGVSDPDGIVRVRIPASAIGSVGATRWVQVTADDMRTFQATAVTRQYDQVWKHKVGGGVSGKVATVKVGGSLTAEAEVRQMFAGGLLSSEVVSRTREFEPTLGLELGGGMKVNQVVQPPKLGAGAFLALDGTMSFAFSPTTTDPGENFMKLYVMQGDLWSVAATPAFGCFDLARNVYETAYLDSKLASAEGELRAGGYANGEVGLRLGPKNEVGLNIGAEFSLEAAVLQGFEAHYGTNNKQAVSVGLSYSGQFDFAAQFRAGKYFALGPFANAGFDGEVRAKLWSLLWHTTPERAEFTQRTAYDLSYGVGLGGKWKGYEGWSALGPGYIREYTESYSFGFPDTGTLSRLEVIEPFWNSLQNSSQGVVKLSQPAALAASVLQLAYNDGTTVDYTNSLYLAKKAEGGLDFELGDYLFDSVGLKLEGSIERGTEVVAESGKVCS